jgi:alpha-tubulin suppressor-like RCC1 family protein
MNMTEISRRTLAASLTVLAACGSNDSTGPAQTEDLGNVAMISAGGAHTCALRTDGSAFCWGRNDHRQLGDGTASDHPTPVAAAVGRTFTSISAGARHTCGVTVSNEAYCWGDSFQGQGGVASQATLQPTRVGQQSFTQVSPGLEHSCGVATGGIGYCWGTAILGNDTANITLHPTPARVSGSTYQAVSAATNYTCGIRAGGAAFCWGVNASGVLGIGSLQTPMISPTAVTGGLAFSSLSAGTAHVCGIAAGTVNCWGSNNDGQLGLGAAGGSPQTAPRPITGTRSYVSVGAGGAHTCAVAADGLVYCWGRNTLGQLGIGTNTQQPSPTKIAIDTLFASVSAGDTHTCAVTRSRKAYCWGANTFGQRGDGTVGGNAGFAPVPVQIP